MVELSVAFEGNITQQKRFLEHSGISHGEAWTAVDTEASHPAWNAYIKSRRLAKVPKRPVADILIGGFAITRQGLVTRNPADFKRWFPKLLIREP
ncbi:MAG: type II toxin-antitoxin system VapC family toxin, partial [bacterium]|nr:type II toxin-antitoxin system VapC family toxin [bacterium]